jgi:pyruvate,water dikinase
MNRALSGLATDGEWQEFMAAYGHRSYSLDIVHPTFADAPEQVCHLSDAAEETSNWEIGAARRTIAEQETRQALQVQRWGWLKVRLFRWVMGYARRYMPLREDQRFFWQKALAVQRRLALWIGGRLVERGWMERPDHVFFVTVDELRQAVDGQLLPAEEIQLRSDEFNRLAKASETAPDMGYPRFLRGNEPYRETEQDDAHILRGCPVSPGVARGPARVVTSPRELDRVVAGDILVTWGADPGWTPIFGRIAGLVMEVGGQLSHGAVVAREYGLPAVAGVRGVTQSIEDGQEIFVDALSGTVSVDTTRAEGSSGS